jgi:hypothetical protein
MDDVSITAELPAQVGRGTNTTSSHAPCVVPALITEAGEQAGWRYAEFFSANICNSHTHRAYARACGRFFAWCEGRGLTLTTIRPPTSPAISTRFRRATRRPA